MTPEFLKRAEEAVQINGLRPGGKIYGLASDLVELARSVGNEKLAKELEEWKNTFVFVFEGEIHGVIEPWDGEDD